VWWGDERFDAYDRAVGRFMSEYGFQSLPDIRTIRSFTVPEDRPIDSGVMRAHQKHDAGNQIIKTHMADTYGVPDDLEDFVYVSQLLQAEGIRRAIEAHRRARPYCMGTLYWQLNDCWPATSWSGRDYYGRWKALHYFVRAAFDDVLVSVTAEHNRINVYCISDRMSPLAATLVVKVKTFGGDILFEREVAADLPPGSSASYMELADRPGFRNAVLVAELWKNGRRLSADHHYFAEAKDLDLPEPEIEWTVTRVDNGYRVTLTSALLARNVFLSCDTDGFFSDNFFDLLPGRSTTVVFSPAETPSGPAPKISVRSLADIYR
jgi:beta-mannosidase